MFLFFFFKDVKFSSEYVMFEMPEKNPGLSEYAKEAKIENIIPE